VWGKREDMIVRDQSPFNAEPPAAVLAEGGVTALDAFYARNHGAFPDIPVEEWRLTVDGMVDKASELTGSSGNGVQVRVADIRALGSCR